MKNRYLNTGPCRGRRGAGAGPRVRVGQKKVEKNSKNCPNYVIIINKVVEDVRGDVRDVSEHISDDLL